MRASLLVLLLGCASQSSSSNPIPDPSCGQSMAQFYANGCTFLDASGKPIALGTVVDECVQFSAAAPSECVDELDAWMLCLDQPPPATGKSTCGCTQEQAAFMSCQ